MIRLLALLLFFTHVIPAHAIDPRWKYKVLTSPHFELLYREDHAALAKRYIIASERAFDLLMPIFKEGPSKTYVLLRDDTDSANGLADFLPYPRIVIFPVLPSQADTIDEYGDWPLEVMIHEYAHILNMYPAHSFYWPFKFIFGSVVRPNAMLPRWYLEGLAVNLESQLSTHGRLRATDTAAAARAYFLGGRFKNEDIATINEADGKTWPYGARPYLFGGWWWNEAHKRKGTEGIYTLNQNFSRRLPFFINGPIEEQLGASAGELFHQTLNELSAQAKRETDAVAAAGGQTSTDEIDSKKGDAGAFAVSPSGNRLVYWLGLIDEGSFAFLRERGQPARKLFRTVGTYRIAWINENSFIFDQVDARNPYVAYRDLYRYDIKTDQITRLTNGLRAQEAAVSPNGLWVAFIQNDAGRNKLSIMEVSGRSPRVLVQGNLNQRLASPEFLSDGEILFTGRTVNGEEKIYSYNLGNKRRQVWNSTLKSAQALRRTPAGMLVSDAGTGIRNIYRVQADQAQALTNTATSIQFADFDPIAKTVVINELTPNGPRLKAVPLHDAKPPNITLAKLDPAPALSPTKVSTHESSFNPIKYLVPRYLIPMIYPVEEGVIVQGLTNAQDPLERNTLSLSGSYDTLTKKTSYGVGYLNSSLTTNIGTSYSNYHSYLGASGRVIDSQDARLEFSGPVGNRFTNWWLAGMWSETESVVNNYRRIGPTAGFSYDGMNSPYNERFGWHAEFAHTQFLEQDGYLAYGRSSAHLANVIRLGRHKVGLQVRGAVAPDMPFRYVLDLGDRSVGGNYLVNLTNSQFLLRGYQSGTFVGRKIVNGNLEWVSPASEIAKGFGTFPLFLRNVELAAFFDTMAVDGAAYDDRFNLYVRSRLREFYSGAGGEVRINTSVAYHVPLVFTLGLYYGLKDEYTGGFTTFLAVGLGSLGPISKKTP
jgi:Tol biopolymer transport system component